MNINIILPKAWQDLSQQELLYTYELLAKDFSSTELKTLFLLHFAKIKVMGREGSVYIIRYKGKEYAVTPQEVCEATTMLNWLDSIPGFPTRLEKIMNHRAMEADFSGVAFSSYLYLDNLYQGFLHTQKTELLKEMAEILYDCSNIRLSRAEEISVFYWFASLKNYFANSFRTFFRPMDNDNGMLGAPPLREKLTDVMNAQIRALTGGDITKEKEVLAMDCWRALTELEAKARDAEEIRRLHK